MVSQLTSNQRRCRKTMFMMTAMNRFWHLWAKALGEKAGNSDNEADRIAIIRTSIVLIYIITNIVIISGVIRHWND
jgi:hypothetical protein